MTLIYKEIIGNNIIMNSGTYYDKRTEFRVIELLETFLHTDTRLKFCLGNAETGEDWEEIYDVTGYIGRSMGPEKVPILLHNKRSIGGSAILTHCIVKIDFSNKKNGGILYKHPKYHRREVTPPTL